MGFPHLLTFLSPLRATLSLVNFPAHPALSPAPSGEAAASAGTANTATATTTGEMHEAGGAHRNGDKQRLGSVLVPSATVNQNGPCLLIIITPLGFYKSMLKKNKIQLLK